MENSVLMSSITLGHVETSKKVRQKILQHLLSVCCFFTLTSFDPVAADTDTVNLGQQIKLRYKQQRQMYLQLKDLVEDGRYSLAADRTDELKGYPLSGHLEYLLLRKTVAESDAPVSLLGQVNALRQQHLDDRSHRRLLGGLKNRAVKLERWKDYAAIAKSANAPTHPCDDLLARIKNNQIKKFDVATGELWTVPARHTNNCDAAFKVIIKQTGDVPTRALWQRTVALLIAGKKNQARDLLGFFNKRDRQVVMQWIDQIDTPEQLIKSAAMQGKTEHHRRLVKFVLRRWARKDLVAASRFWAQSGTSFGFSQADVINTVGGQAVLAAKRRMPEAADLLKAASDDNRGVRYWRVRIALRQQDWRSAVLHLENLTAKERQSSRWQYWRARSLAELGYTGAAEKIYKRLAVKVDYHGFLAADQLGLTYPIDISNPKASSEEIEKLLENPQIARAVEFFLVDIGWEGRRAWNNALTDASDSQLIAAAQIALSVGWYDRAYAAIKRTSLKSALAYLFPTPHMELVNQTAALNSVANALVYGVIRQESGYIPDVKSPAGAVGLMQLMPGTAKDMGKKLGLSAPAWKLIDGELNIRLGIQYLNLVLRRFDENTVLAAAAYNAGPHRVKQWLMDEALPADIWVETIPFDETRDYVKGVLFNTTVSEWRLKNGALTRLRARMPDVLPLG